MNLIDIAARHRAWLGQRQALVSANIANVNTPGYVAHSTQDFATALRSLRMQPAAGGSELQKSGIDIASTATAADQPMNATHSGNTVNIEKELLSAGEVRNGYALNVSIMKAFSRMLLASTRG